VSLFNTFVGDEGNLDLIFRWGCNSRRAAPVWLRWTGRVHHPEAGDEEPSCGLLHYILAVPAIAFSGCVSRERSVASVFTRSVSPWPRPAPAVGVLHSFCGFCISKLYGWVHNCAY
jgi:hypothetical protein